MSFTVATLTGSYINETGGPAAGEVTFTLPVSISNAGVTLPAGTTSTVKLDASGNLSQQLVSTQDAGTLPQGVNWRFDERLSDATRTFYAPVPSGGVSVPISSLSPFVQGPPAWG